MVPNACTRAKGIDGMRLARAEGAFGECRIYAGVSVLGSGLGESYACWLCENACWRAGEGVERRGREERRETETEARHTTGNWVEEYQLTILVVLKYRFVHW